MNLALEQVMQSGILKNSSTVVYCSKVGVSVDGGEMHVQSKGRNDACE